MLENLLTQLTEWPTAFQGLRITSLLLQERQRRRRILGLRPIPTMPKKNSKSGYVKKRDRVLVKLGIVADDVDSVPAITPVLRHNAISEKRLVDTLRCDNDPESLTFVRFWDSVDEEDRDTIGIEAMAVGAGVTPRRLWELYQGALLVQSRESVGLMIADALPKVFKVTIKNAQKMRGLADREHLYKISKALPIPKGSTTIINPLPPQAALPAPKDDDEESTAGDLESADDFLMRASKAMYKKLPAAPVAEVEPEIEVPGAE